MQLALQTMREAMLEENVTKRPVLVTTPGEIQELMDYKQFFDVERRFLSADQLTRKYGTEQSAS